MSNSHIIPVILTGGNGTRLWPLSRKQHPKQFLKISDQDSLLQKTLQRIDHLADPVLLCAIEHRFLVASQLDEINRQACAIITEPCVRDTAPAISVAALMLQQKYGGDTILVVLPADHEIPDTEQFKQDLTKAIELAKTNDFVVLGVKASSPETEFGYIKVSAHDKQKVEKFVEKPNIDTALAYLKSGDYFWNSGIVIAKAHCIVNAMQTFEPTLVSHCKNALSQADIDPYFINLSVQHYTQLIGISFDYAVLEKSIELALSPLNAAWSDMGNWRALWQQANKDADDNACFGDVIQNNCQRSLIYSDNKLVTALGVDDLIIVDTKDALLVTKRDQAHKVKDLVDDLKQQQRIEYQNNREVIKPWGSFDLLEQGAQFKVKLLKVNSGEKLSLQKHQHRTEHWVIVSGTAKVQLADNTFTLVQDQSIYIPKDVKHCLENIGDNCLQVIEIQSGAHLEESDIIRLVDKYKRAT